LDPGKYYIACRWDKQVTPYNRLKDCVIVVTNPLTGKSLPARAVDWGPNQSTGRIADLSPQLEKDLGLETDDECIVTVTLPLDLANNPPSPPPVTSPGNGIVRQLKTSEINLLFDSLNTPGIDYRSHTNGRIDILNSDVRDKIKSTKIDQLVGIRGAPDDGMVECHGHIALFLQAAFAEIAEKQLLDRILTFDGLWVPRHINWNPNRGISLHSWGIAFDINAHWNGFGAHPPETGEHGSVRELVAIFEKHGFYWGGHFRHADGMHFQWGRDTV
jgi:hypothetical protein